MLVLALDTSSAAVSAGLVEVTGDGVTVPVAEHCVVDGRRHGELLAAGVRQVLTGGRRPEAVVVGAGPGPFTGLRVGLVTAAAYADAAGIPAYGQCSLDGLATSRASREVVAVADARRREVYWARYVGSVRVQGPAVDTPSDLLAQLGLGDPPPLLVGAGAVLHAQVLGADRVDGQRPYPDLSALVAAAAHRVLAGGPGEALVPLYLRRPDAVPAGAAKTVTPATPA